MVRRSIILALSLLAAPAASLGEPKCKSTEFSSLPRWFHAANLLPQGLRVSCHLNPFYQRGDFDADGQIDLAVLVTEASSGKKGVAVVHRASLKVFVLGAGVSFGNGGDDFNWMDVWGVVDAPRAPNHYEPELPAFQAEGLTLVKSASASGFVGWVGDHYVWFQTSD